MKYDLNSKTNRFAKRTLSAFSEGLFDMLETKSFENIMVNELCDKANYPRATFYNYFEDIYDLLEYCWYAVSQKINIEDYKDMEAEERVHVLFDRLYDFMDEHRIRLNHILKHNKEDGQMAASLHRYMGQQIRTIMMNSPCTAKYEIPYELVADHYCNTLLLVIEWSFLKSEKYTKGDAKKSIMYLLNGI